VTAKIDDYEPTDLDLTFPAVDHQPEVPRPPRPVPTVPATPDHGWRIIAAVAVVVALVFGLGTCTGDRLNDAEVRTLMLEANEASVRASAAANEAQYWQSEATSATAAYEAVESDVASLTASLLQWQLQAKEASSTIATLKQQKATPKPVPQAPTRVSATPATGEWQTARASWYGPGLYGNTTANGNLYTPELLCVAHKTLPMGTLVTIRYNGREITVPVLDRGPYVDGRQFDLSGATAAALGFSGVQTIEYRIGG
jgi:rare lipoprotein A (peptidoglycan hydrolase)